MHVQSVMVHTCCVSSQHMIRTLSDKLPDKGAQLHKQKAMVMERMSKLKRTVPKSLEEAHKISATTTGSKAAVSCA